MFWVVIFIFISYIRSSETRAERKFIIFNFFIDKYFPVKVIYLIVVIGRIIIPVSKGLCIS